MQRMDGCVSSENVGEDSSAWVSIRKGNEILICPWLSDLRIEIFMLSSHLLVLGEKRCSMKSVSFLKRNKAGPDHVFLQEILALQGIYSDLRFLFLGKCQILSFMPHCGGGGFGVSK